jgi:hypothetical protein
MKPSRGIIVSAFAASLLLAGCGSTTVNAPAAAPSPTGSIERLAGVYLDTRLEINNKTGEKKILTLGADCIDPSRYLPKTLSAGEMVSAVGYCGTSDADVGGEFARGSLLSPTWISFHAHSPKVGWPSISIDGAFHDFEVGDTCAFNAQGQIFEATRRTDLSGAKDMVLTWVNATTLPGC